MNIFCDYVSQPIECKYRMVQKYGNTVSQEEALRDVDELRYPLDNGYSGKNYWERKGFSFCEYYKHITSYVNETEDIYISDFCRAIHQAFDKGIVDNHFSFASPLTGRLGYSKKKIAYFANILAEKIADQYVIVSSKEENVSIGSILNSTEYLYPTLSPTGREHYLIGLRSWNAISQMRLTIDGREVSISLHKSRASYGDTGGNRDICLQHTVVDTIDVVRSTCCDFVYPLTKGTNIVEIGKKLSSTEKFIWNNLSNEGGYSRIPRDFLHGVNEYVCCEEYCAKLISPLTEGRDCAREWVFSDPAAVDKEKGTYNGTVYFLMNSDTASSGETSVLYAKTLRNVVFLGENSMGCNTFGNVSSYQLSNSKIVLRVPNMINLCKNPDDCIEGEGFAPDFWVDSYDVQGEVIRWISDNENYMPTL